MKIKGQHRLDAPRELVWKAINDPEILAKTVPGLQELNTVGENRYQGALNISMGPVQGRFSGEVELSDIDAPSGYSMRVDGKGAPGFVQGAGTIRLEEDGDATVVHYDLDAQVGGRLAAIGQRLIDSSARVITGQALDGLSRQVEGLKRAEATGERVEVEAPSQTAFAAGVARGVLADAVPPKGRPWIAVTAVVIVLVAAVLLFRGCTS
ncbi:MAG: carbon monoxide dehydrogenase subunit G [Acidobacteriota bacterium]|nr:carbon monoxide dehydrogenase subunit G [Acidobacteriota bacterium]